MNDPFRLTINGQERQAGPLATALVVVVALPALVVVALALALTAVGCMLAIPAMWVLWLVAKRKD